MPDRRDTNLEPIHFGSHLARVSMPDRRDTNELFFGFFIEIWAGFQCLIGAIQTSSFSVRVFSYSEKFQCLIGAIQTEKLRKLKKIIGEFQCLIGAIQTRLRQGRLHVECLVSMPDRRDTN